MIKRNYVPGTETTRRRPTPITFAHLRKWIAAEEQFVDIVNITELTNINEQIEQVSKLFINNIVQRSISQMIAAYGDGFVTLQASAEGQLHVISDRELKTITSAKIDFSASGDTTIVTGQAGKKIKLASLVFTVGGETNITLKAGATAFTGPMDFGGTNEPRGVVDTHGFCAYEVTEGQSFVMNSSAAVQVSGYVTGFIE